MSQKHFSMNWSQICWVFWLKTVSRRTFYGTWEIESYPLPRTMFRSWQKYVSIKPIGRRKFFLQFSAFIRWTGRFNLKMNCQTFIPLAKKRTWLTNVMDTVAAGGKSKKFHWDLEFSTIFGHSPLQLKHLTTRNAWMLSSAFSCPQMPKR